MSHLPTPTSGLVAAALLLTGAIGAEAFAQDQAPHLFGVAMGRSAETISARDVEEPMRSVGVIRVPDDHDTIQEAIDAAENGNTILVAPGTYQGEGNKDIVFYGRAVAVICDGLPGECIIDCEDAGRAFDLSSGEGPDAIIDGFSITRGRAAGGGGGIRINAGSPTIQNCFVESCHTVGDGVVPGQGGGILVEDATPLIKNCVVRQNSAEDSGGGIAVLGSTLATLQNLTIIHNTEGGLFIEDSVALTNSCILYFNVLNGDPLQITVTGSGAIARVEFSNVEGGRHDVEQRNGGVLAWGDASARIDPRFAGEFDHHLTRESWCVDHGDNRLEPLGERDIDGQERLVNDRLDMGAHEYVCIGDLDGNGQLGFAEVLAVLGAWGPCSGCPEDFVGDEGDVGFGEVLFILGNWGPCR